MPEKNSLFQYLYSSLKKQILVGRYFCGESLPSASRLCELYNVGIRTARDVLRALKMDGLIRTEERRCAVVIYQENNTLQNQRMIQSVLERRHAISDVYMTMSVLMPPLFWLCAKHGRLEVPNEMELKIKRVKWISPKECWRLPSTVLNWLLTQSGNPLFHDLYSCLELFCQVPEIEGCRHPFEAARDMSFLWMMEPMRGHDIREAQRRFRFMYLTVGDATANYLDQLHRQFPWIEERRDAAFRWDAAKGKIYFYAQIARELVERLYHEEWRDGEYLPPIQELAGQYGVSRSTMRQALDLMEGRGFIRIRNGCGTQVTLSSAIRDIQHFSDPTQKRDTLMYLYALHFMVVALRPAALAAFDHLGEEQWRQMEQSLLQGGDCALRVFSQCLFQALPYDALRVAFLEINKLLSWGQHFKFSPHAKQGLHLIENNCHKALRCLKNDDSEGYADHLIACYRWTYDGILRLLKAAGAVEAEKLISP